jgi:hypothetical protein
MFKYYGVGKYRNEQILFEKRKVTYRENDKFFAKKENFAKIKQNSRKSLKISKTFKLSRQVGNVARNTFFQLHLIKVHAFYSKIRVETKMHF